MQISFANKRLQRTFNSKNELARSYGHEMAKSVAKRMAVLESAPSLGHVPVMKPERCHQLKGDREGQFAVDLVHPKRLVFRPDHEPIPKLKDGGIDRSAVTAVVILDICDYH